MAITRTYGRYNGILNDGEVDRFQYVSETGGEIKLKFTHPDGVGAGGTPIELRLIDSAGNVISRLTAHGHAVMEATIPSKGNYSIEVRDADYRTRSPGAYELATELAFAAGTIYDGGANSTPSTAMVAPLGAPIVGRTEENDIDYFKIHTDSGGVFRLRFAHPNGPGVEGATIAVKIFSSLQSSLVISPQESNVAYRELKGDGILEMTLPRAGDYFIEARELFWKTPDPGLYRMVSSLIYYKDVVYDGPDNNSPSKAPDLPLGKTAIGKLEPNDSDYFKFDVPSGGNLSLNFLHPNGVGSTGERVGLELMDSTGKQLLEKGVYGSALLTVDLANGGTYYLKVHDPFYKSMPGLYTAMLGLSGNGGKTIVLSNAGGFTGTSGSDVVHGSTGRDVMTGLGNASAYDIGLSPLGAGATVQERSGTHAKDTLFNVERLQFADRMVALDIEGNGGHAFRLYKAAFDRLADETGLGFWIHQLDHGGDLHAVAEGFIASGEFRQKYGPNSSNKDFVLKLYGNVLHRPADEGGVEYWVKQLQQGTLDRADVLVEFSKSEENVAQLVGATEHGMTYTQWHA